MPENASSSTPATTSTSQDISIVCSDGFELGGTLFRPDKVKCAVMIGPATGIKRGVYHHFAAYLADNG
ncbi:MAG: alpha/beta hydrolase, partial [Bacteroidota bacterium]